MGKVIAFSGTPIKGGTIEKGLKTVLAATGAETEFIRLADLNMKVCIGCKKCAVTNRCVHKDDVNPILDRIEEAEALILSGYPSFGSVNALTKIFIERLWPLRHNHTLTKGKVGAAVTCCGGKAPTGLEEYFAHYFKDYLFTRYQGALSLDGNVPCMSCGYGEECVASGFLRRHGPGAKMTPDKFHNFDNDPAAQERARLLGEAVGSAMAVG